MREFRIFFYGAGDELPYMMDIRAKELDAAEEQARAFLIMGGGRYKAAEVFEPWRTLWRSSGRKFDYSPNL